MVDEVKESELKASAQDVKKQLQRITASRAFQRSEKITRFLEFIAKETLAGRGAKLKEFSVGVEVFDRDSAFDPRFDPIVRVQARRLRAQLVRYYAEEASPGELIIEVPKGRYAVTFKSGKSNKPASSKRASAPLLISRNTVVAMPFRDYSPSGDQKSLCAGIDQEIIRILTESKIVRLAAWGGALSSCAEVDLE
jgi:hypothetical protein